MNWAESWSEIMAVGLDRFEIRGWHSNGKLIVRFASADLSDLQWGSSVTPSTTGGSVLGYSLR